MELCIVKVKTKSDNSFRKKNWAIKIWKILENKGEVLVFRGLCIMLKFNHGVFWIVHVAESGGM